MNVDDVNLAISLTMRGYYLWWNLLPARGHMCLELAHRPPQVDVDGNNVQWRTYPVYSHWRVPDTVVKFLMRHAVGHPSTYGATQVDHPADGNYQHREPSGVGPGVCTLILPVSEAMRNYLLQLPPNRSRMPSATRTLMELRDLLLQGWTHRCSQHYSTITVCSPRVTGEAIIRHLQVFPHDRPVTESGNIMVSRKVEVSELMYGCCVKRDVDPVLRQVTEQVARQGLWLDALRDEDFAGFIKILTAHDGVPEDYEFLGWFPSCVTACYFHRMITL